MLAALAYPITSTGAEYDREARLGLRVYTSKGL
jgi:hypothetical protein